MSEVTLKELRKEKEELESKLGELISEYQKKFGVEIREISLDHRRSEGRAEPYSTDVSVDIKLT